MSMSKVAVCVLVGIASATVFATDWYVDANSGNDSWDGTAAVIPTAEQVEALSQAGEPIPGPRKTLHAMMSDARVSAGDTVWAAAPSFRRWGRM